MNLTQWLLILVPYVAAYLWFILNTESEGRVQWRSNALMGLVAIPLATIFMPALALQAAKEGIQKRRIGVVAGATVALLVFIGYGIVVYALRDCTPPTPVDQPLER